MNIEQEHLLIIIFGINYGRTFTSPVVSVRSR